jgi:acetyl-CoA carboxylase biotin carboxyl carrier protein
VRSVEAPFRQLDPVLKEPQMKLNLEELKSLIATLEEGGVGEFEYEDENSRVRLSFGSPAAPPAQVIMSPAAVAPAAPAGPTPSEDEAADYITSPFVGTFYTASSPEADPFTAVGKMIKPGQTLCIVEAMKLMNEIESEISGKVLDVLVENGTSVEFGQKLFKVSKG